MLKYRSYLPRETWYLFYKQVLDMKKCEDSSFATAFDEKNKMYIMGKDVVEEMKETSDDKVEEYNDMIFDIDEYYRLEKDMVEEKMKIQMDKDVCAGLSLALMNR